MKLMCKLCLLNITMLAGSVCQLFVIAVNKSEDTAIDTETNIYLEIY